MIVIIAVVCAFADSAKAQNADLLLSGRTSEISIQSNYRFGVTVIDPDENPLPGVTIMCNGGGGTVTNEEGNATVVSTRNPASLVISCVGYKTVKLKVSGTPYITVVLEPEETMLD